MTDIEKNKKNDKKNHKGFLAENKSHTSSLLKRARKTIAMYLILLVSILVILGILFYTSIKGMRLNDLQNQQRAMLHNVHDVINRDIKMITDDLKILAAGEHATNLFDNSGNINPKEKQALIRHFLLKSEITDMYYQLRILDKEGMEVIRVDQKNGKTVLIPDIELQNEAEELYFKETIKLNSGEVYISEMDLAVSNGRIVYPHMPTFRGGIPFTNEAGEKMGIIVFNFNADIILQDISLFDNIDKNKDLMLLDPRGYWLKGTTTDVEWAFMYPGRESVSFAHYYPEEWKQIMSKNSGTFASQEGAIAFKKIYSNDTETFENTQGGEKYYWIAVSMVSKEVLTRENLNLLRTIVAGGIIIFLLVEMLIVRNIHKKEELKEVNLILLTKNKLLEVSEEKYREVNEIAKIGQWTLNLDTDLLSFDEEFSKIMKFDDLLKDTCPFEVFLNLVHPDDQNTVAFPHYESLKPLQNKELIYRIVTKDGKIKWIHDRYSIERDEKGKPLSLVGIIQDITKLKQTEEKLKEQKIQAMNLKQKAEKASAAKSEFLSNMSHEIRTPINAIVGFTELALKTSLTPQLSNYIKKIKTSSQTLLELINDILDISKIEADMLVLENKSFNLENLIQNVVTQVSVKSDQKKLELVVFIDKKIPIILFGDELRLKQVLTNIANNAVKFTDKGEVALRVELIRNANSSVLLQFSVEDTGIGMSEEQIKNLFIPFTQAEASTTREYGGTGLGLAISKNIVDMMKGDIWVESEEGKGSTFFFTAEFNVADQGRCSDCINAFEKYGMKVLLVDDNEKSRNAVGNILLNMSFNVTMCTSGEEAINLFKVAKEETGYDLVIMDNKMAGMDGIEAIRHIKELFSSGDVPAMILLSSFNESEVIEKANLLGVEAVLYKPLTPSILYNWIMKIFGKEVFDQVSAGSESENETKFSSKFQDIKVLLVEDNEINQEVAHEILKAVGMTVAIANNGIEAVDMVKTDMYDIVLMDIQMPKMDGYDATREIRKDPAFAELPIIAMTANALRCDKEKCFDVGMNDYITKPVDTVQLFQIIRHWIKRKETNLGKKTFAEYNSLSSKEEIKEKSKENNHLTLESADVDVQSALSRLGNNYKFYERLLTKFCNNHKNAVEEIKQAVAQGDFKTAEILTHTLKGAAGNIGAKEVYLTASILEAELRASRQGNANQLLKKLKKALVQLLDTHTALEEDKENVEHLSKAVEEINSDVLLELVEFKKLVEDHDMDAVECFEGIVIKTKNTALYNKLLEIQKILEQYEFDRTLPFVEEIINILKEKEDQDHQNER